MDAHITAVAPPQSPAAVEAGVKDAPAAFGFHKGEKNIKCAEAVAKWREANQGYLVSKCQIGASAISVCVRCRPWLPALDVDAPTASPDDYDSVTCFNPRVYIHSAAERLGVQTGALDSVPTSFDATFGSGDDNDAIFESCLKPLLSHVEAGGSATAIAFGATGSGKTHTQRFMQERAVSSLLAPDVAEGNGMGQRMVSISFFENCGDRVFDLLAQQGEGGARVERSVRVDGDGNVHVAGLVEAALVTDPAAALAVLEQGSRLRATMPTANNPESSRSHAICLLRFYRAPPAPPTAAAAAAAADNAAAAAADSAAAIPAEPVLVGTLRVVDLAGSEGGKSAYFHTDGARVEEMKQINWSLGCLKECIR
jgi:kinesin family protein 2/24